MTSIGTTDPPAVPNRQPPPEPNCRPGELCEDTDYAGRRIRGSRELQEDTYGVVPREEFGGTPADLFVVVADGMGGHAAGEVASALAVETFAQRFLNGTDGCDATRLWCCLEESNRRIRTEVESRGEAVLGMGTTLVAVLKRANHLRWISVGDSPLYLLRQGRLRRLNELHSHAALLAEKVRLGEITTEQAAIDPDRHTLTAALIGEAIYQVDDADPISLEPADVIIVATDGIHSLSDDEIAQAASGAGQEGNAASIADAIIAAVERKQAPKQDNTTVVVIRVR